MTRVTFAVMTRDPACNDRHAAWSTITTTESLSSVLFCLQASAPLHLILKMAIQNPDATQAVEREMTNYQRNLVDTCFEEGNYDSAISILDKLRHPSTKPYPCV